MSTRTSYAPGTPSWVDLGTTDPDAASAFYSALFGWDIQEGPPETGGYRMCLLHGAPVAGLMSVMSEDQPPAWMTYVSTDDADATAAKVAEAGGSVVAEPMDVLTFGRMAVFADDAGAQFAAWQPRDHIGAGVVNETGALVWNELNVRDAEAAMAFYGAVFGWRGEPVPDSPMPYTQWMLGEDGIAGMIQMTDQWPPEVPPHWVVYFAVDDCDASCARAQELGGSVSVEPFDIPIGRFAMLGDPQGAFFSVIAMNEMPD